MKLDGVIRVEGDRAEERGEGTLNREVEMSWGKEHGGVLREWCVHWVATENRGGGGGKMGEVYHEVNKFNIQNTGCCFSIFIFSRFQHLQSLCFHVAK